MRWYYLIYSKTIIFIFFTCIWQYNILWVVTGHSDDTGFIASWTKSFFECHAKENLFKSTFIQRTLPEAGPTNMVISNKDSNFIGD